MNTEQQQFVVDYEIVDHGEDHAQYFPGCGVAFTDFDAVSTGCGDSFAEALADAIEQSVCGGDEWPADLLDAIGNEVTEGSPEITKHHEEWHYYVSVRVKYGRADSNPTWGRKA